MVRSPRTRVLVLGFALALSAQAAWAEPRQTEDAPGAAWDLVTQLWNAVTVRWSDVGCILDPHGGCGTAQAPAPEADIGCWIDPNGGCGPTRTPAPPPETDVGCWLDPYGSCGAGR